MNRKTNKKYREKLNVSSRTALRELSDIMSKGVIERRGSGTYYIIKECDANLTQNMRILQVVNFFKLSRIYSQIGLYPAACCEVSGANVGISLRKQII